MQVRLCKRLRRYGCNFDGHTLQQRHDGVFPGKNASAGIDDKGSWDGNHTAHSQELYGLRFGLELLLEQWPTAKNVPACRGFDNGILPPVAPEDRRKAEQFAQAMLLQSLRERVGVEVVHQGFRLIQKMSFDLRHLT